MLIRMTIEDVLADLGCESVFATATAETAVALVAEHVFDAAVLDINLNGTCSPVVADALAAAGVPFVIATGNPGEVWEGFRDRAVLRKPFQYGQLAESIANLLTR